MRYLWTRLRSRRPCKTVLSLSSLLAVNRELAWRPQPTVRQLRRLPRDGLAGWLLALISDVLSGGSAYGCGGAPSLEECQAWIGLASALPVLLYREYRWVLAALVGLLPTYLPTYLPTRQAALARQRRRGGDTVGGDAAGSDGGRGAAGGDGGGDAGVHQPAPPRQLLSHLQVNTCQDLSHQLWRTWKDAGILDGSILSAARWAVR